MTTISEDLSLQGWITLAEAAELLGLNSTAELADEINLSTRAVLFTYEMLKNGISPTKSLAVCNYKIPVRMVRGFDYMFTTVEGSRSVVHPISHVYLEAVLPWAAQRTVELLKEDAGDTYCLKHGYVPDRGLSTCDVNGPTMRKCGLPLYRKSRPGPRLPYP